MKFEVINFNFRINYGNTNYVSHIRFLSQMEAQRAALDHYKLDNKRQLYNELVFPNFWPISQLPGLKNILSTFSVRRNTPLSLYDIYINSGTNNV